MRIMKKIKKKAVPWWAPLETFGSCDLLPATVDIGCNGKGQLLNGLTVAEFKVRDYGRGVSTLIFSH